MKTLQSSFFETIFSHHEQQNILLRNLFQTEAEESQRKKSDFSLDHEQEMMKLKQQQENDILGFQREFDEQFVVIMNNHEAFFVAATKRAETENKETLTQKTERIKMLKSFKHLEEPQE